MVLAAFGVILAILILEIALRLSSKKVYSLGQCQSLDRDFHHVMVPNSTCRFKTDEWDVVYKINSLGLREREIMEKKVGTFRILLLGDSFVQGHGVEAEDSFGEVFERRLNSNTDNKKNYDVVNTGVFAYSPLLEYLWLKKEGLKLEPNLVILSFSLTDFWEDRQRFSELIMSNPDLSDWQLKERTTKAEVEFNFEKINLSAGVNVSKKANPSFYKIKAWLRENSKIYATFVDFVKKRNQPVQQDMVYQGDIDHDIVALIRGNKISNEDWEKLWELPMQHISEMKKLLGEKDIPFLIVGIPEAVQVSHDEWPARAGLGLPKDFSDPRGDFQQELGKRLKSINVPFINLLDGFRESGIFPLYFSDDGHFRESGHHLAAQIIYDWPEFQLLIK